MPYLGPVEWTAGFRRNQSEQARSGIKSKSIASKLNSPGQRQVGERPSEHHIKLCRGEIADGVRGGSSGQQNFLTLRLLVISIRYFPRQPQLAAPTTRRHCSERSGAGAAAEDSEFGLGKERKQVRPRCH
jgi:hypothetical protein